MPLRTAALALFCSALFAGCQPTVGDDDSTPPPLGCVQVAGGGAFEEIQDAIDAAPEGGVITICAGTYAERLDIGKPLTLAGEERDAVQIVGDGGGTIIDVDLYALGVDAGPVTLSSLSVIGRAEDVGTIRGIRASSAPDLVINDVLVGFQTDEAVGFDHGSTAVELSQTHAVLSDMEITSVGFSNPNGGTGVLVQTDASVEIVDSMIVGTGSFGVHADDASLILRGTQILSTNRNELAEDGESDGSGIYVENGSDTVEIHDSVIDGGSFVAAWIESTGLLVTGSTFRQFGYGIYVPGDAGSAAGRSLDVEGSTFEDLVGQSILAVASTRVSTSTFTNTTGAISDETGFPRYAGINAIAPGGEILVTGSTFVDLGDWAIRATKGGSLLDPDVETVAISGNTIDHVFSGNGAMILDTADATFAGNIVYDIDHVYFQDVDGGGAEAGAILNGFGLAAFRVGSLTMSENDIGASGFGNYVIVDSSFHSTLDTSRDGTWNGFHVETSQGTMDGTQLLNHICTGAYFSDATVEMTGATADVSHRGPYFADQDGFQDPLPENLFSYYGGRAIETFSSGTPSSFQVSESTFTNHDAGAIYASSLRVEILDSTFRDNGAEDAVFGQAGSVISIYGQDEASSQSHEIAGNIIDGGLASYAMEVWDSPGAEVRNNTVCVGNFAGLSLGRSPGAVLDENDLGWSDDASVLHCGEVQWNYGIYLSLDHEEGDPAIELDENRVLAPTVYSVFASGRGRLVSRNQELADASSAAIYVSSSLPIELQIDDDGDGWPEYLRDCDDTDPNVRSGYEEVPGNGIDDDCSGVADDGVSTLDSDGDGWSVANGDCEDLDPAVSPGMAEVLDNGQDDDCNGVVDDGLSTVDGDGDGVTVLDGDCDDADTSRSPQAAELGGNGADDDCDGAVDEPDLSTDNDGDGATLGDGDCDDTDSTRFPGAIEVFGNGIDDNCDGWADMDAEFSGISLELSGNNIHDTMTAVIATGAEVLFGTDPLSPDVLTDLSGSIASVSPYTWGNSPLAVGGHVRTGALQATGVLGDCIVLSGQGASADLDGTTLGCGGSGITVQGAATLSLGTGMIVGAGNHGIYVAYGADAEISGGTISGAVNDGVRAQSGTAVLAGTTIEDAAQHGIACIGGSVTATDVEIGSSGVVGAYLSGGSLSLSGGTVTGSGSHGVSAGAGSLTVLGVTVEGNGGDGVLLSGVVTAVVDDAILSTNQGAGLTCDGDAADPLTSTVTLSTCDATVSGNLGGDFSLTGGCELFWSCTAN